MMRMLTTYVVRCPNIKYLLFLQTKNFYKIIKQVDNKKLLGVTIDQTLSWDKQVDVVALNI